jgi:hypothetical protein
MALRNEPLLASLVTQLNAGPVFLGGEPTGYALNIATEERKFMPIRSLLRERNQ